MSSLNQVSLIGNLGRDPEISQTQDGNPVARLSIATSERWTDKHTGERREKTEWHRVVIFGNLADVVRQYVVKGDKIFVQGQLQTRKWTGQDGIERYTTEVVLRQWGSTLVMLGSRGESSEPRGGGGGYQDHQAPVDQGGQDDLDDHIPF